jgi:hypothetical protein
MEISLQGAFLSEARGDDLPVTVHMIDWLLRARRTRASINTTRLARFTGG